MVIAPTDYLDQAVDAIHQKNFPFAHELAGIVKAKFYVVQKVNGQVPVVTSKVPDGMSPAKYSMEVSLYASSFIVDATRLKGQTCLPQKILMLF